MRAHAWPWVFAFALGGCQLPTLGSNNDGGATNATDAGAEASASTDVIGADCTAVSKNVTLCAAISACPDLMLDPRVFPHCGFRISGSTLDLECYCTGTLCPIGIAPTCADIAGLVENQTEDTVCAKEGLGQCSNLAGASGSSSGGSCNPACTDGCGNTPACYQACGC